MRACSAGPNAVHTRGCYPARRAATLVEVLVTIGIIGMLFLLLLPAVQSIRESSRQVACINKMRQLGLAVHQFHAQHTRYPPGQMFGEHGVGPDSTAWSWIARSLPYLEEGALYSRGNVPKHTIRASSIADTALPTLLCPSDNGVAVRGDNGNLVGFPVGVTNYKAVMGANWGADRTLGIRPGEMQTRFPNVGANGSFDGLSEADGIMFRIDYKKRRSDADVVDGCSNTLMLGEALPDYDIFCSWPYANGAYSTCAIPPNTMNVWRGDWPNSQSFRSNHPGRLAFCLADGAVRYVPEAINLSVYRALATIDGGEVAKIEQE